MAEQTKYREFTANELQLQNLLSGLPVHEVEQMLTCSMMSLLISATTSKVEALDMIPRLAWSLAELVELNYESARAQHAEMQMGLGAGKQ